MSKHKREQLDALRRSIATASPLISAEQVRRKTWAHRWFDGSARCPRCGGEDLHRLGVRAGGDTRVEEWQCAAPGCAARWKVELRETAVALLTEGVPARWEWYERKAHRPTFQILIEDGGVHAVRLAPGSPAPQMLPNFVVCEMEQSDRIASLDSQNRGTDPKSVPFIGDTG